MKHPHLAIEELLVRVAHKRIPMIDLSLERVRALLAALGNPQEHLPPVVHVAGTNGKGSLLAYLKAILEAAGYRVHRYTSPHLVTFNERIVLAGKDIVDAYLLELLERIAPLCEAHPVTGFEATTVLAFMAFAEVKADIVLLETGMGGRLDATNVLSRPLLTAITPVSMDHMEFLGSTLAAIAGEKAGILKPNVPCVVGAQKPEAMEVIEQISKKLRAPLLRFSHEYNVEVSDKSLRYRDTAGKRVYPLPNLAGAHQANNAATAIACAKQLKGFSITDAHIRQGITQAHWPARLQRLNQGALAQLVPAEFELWLDGGHNASAGEELARWMKDQQKPIYVICGMMNTKDTEAFLRPMKPYVTMLAAVVIEEEPASQSAEVICDVSAKIGIPNKVTYNIKNSIELIVKSNEYGIMLICGSLLLAGNSLWQNGADAELKSP